MAFVATELLNSRSYSVSNGQTTAARVFVCYDTTTAITTPQSLIDQFGVALPARGDLFPDSLVAWASTYSIVPREGTDQWEITWNYISTPLAAGEVGYVEVSVDYSAQFEDTYRQEPNLPEFGTITIEGDIGGDRIDICGVPLSALRYKTEFTVTETVEYDTYVNIIQPNVLQAIGKRNLQVFQGAPIGKVVYKGASLRRMSADKWQVSHSMQYDGDYHLVQVPIRGANGDITLDKYSKPYTQTVEVFFRQPFLKFANFSVISPNWS